MDALPACDGGIPPLRFSFPKPHFRGIMRTEAPQTAMAKQPKNQQVHSYPITSRKTPVCAHTPRGTACQRREE